MRCTSLLTAFASAVALVLTSPAQSAVIFGDAVLTGTQEVPPVTTTASGVVFFVLDELTGLLDLSGSVDDLFLADITFPSGPLVFGVLGPFHIHDGAAGVNGPIITPFNQASFFTDTATGMDIFASGVAFDLGFVDELLTGQMYFNLHTLTNPGGEIRGQIDAIPEPASALLVAIGLACLGARARAR